MRGVAVAFEAGRAERVFGDGILDLDTGATTYSDGSQTLFDPDGFDSNGQITDGQVTLTTIDVPRNFTRVRPYVQPAIPGLPWSAGVIGFRSKASRIATSGNAAYTGIASLYVIDGAGGVSQAGGGIASFAVDFSALSAGLSIDALDPARASGLTGLQFDGMEVAGAVFRGGTLSLQGEHSLGPTQRFNARGEFFGRVDEAGHPDEAGGAVFVQGQDATLVGSFVVD